MFTKILAIAVLLASSTVSAPPPVAEDNEMAALLKMGATVEEIENGLVGYENGDINLPVFVDPTGQGRDPNSVPWEPPSGPNWDWQPTPIVVVEE